MAESSRNPLPSGYDEDFVNAFEDDFQCLICQLPEKEPVQTRCGHRFCKECLEEHFRRQVGKPLTCPADRQTLNRDQDIFRDKATERKILSLIIKCPNGCEWTGELRYKETHLASCPLNDVPCTNENCQVTLKRKDLSEHASVTCQWRIILCEHCSEPHPKCQMETHLASCPLNDVPCTNENCQVTLKRKDLSEHVSVTCQWRIILCEHCSEPHPKCQMENHIREKCKLCPVPCPYKCGALNLRDQDLEDHLETCERFPVRCPNNCEAIISREMVPNHIEDYCSLTKIPCPYAWMGCHTEVQRDQLESHVEYATKSHFDLACAKLNDTQEKLKEKTIQFDRLEERVNVIQHQQQQRQQRQHHKRAGMLQQQLEQKVNTSQTKLEQKLSMERNIFLVCLLLSLMFLTFYLTKLEGRVQKNLEEKLSVMEDRVQKNLEKKVSEVDMVKKDLEDKVDLLNTDLSNRLLILELDTEESRMFIWKITSFEYKLRQGRYFATRYIESVPFYAYGYKLKLLLYPNGYLDGENTHLSIFIKVKKGEYDAILPWGFSKRVIFTLIDQQENPDLRQNVVWGFTADPKNEVFEKSAEDETRLGWGVPKFVSHNNLKTRRFVVNDTLFIKVQVVSPSWL